MEAIGDFVKLLFLLAVVLVGIALFSYNKLQRLAQEIHEKSSNAQVAISKKLSVINQLLDVVKNYQESEQFTYLKISQDATAASMASSYQQSGALLATLQATASRFPELKNSEQYHRLINNIEACEADIQQRRNIYNNAVKEYNSVCLSIPTIFVARLIGFPKAPYLEFDHTGVTEASSLREFRTDDGERLQQLLTSAGGNIASATRTLTNQATQTGKQIVDRANERARDRATVSYFYMTPGGVPQGPATLQSIQARVADGTLGGDVLVAEAGTSDWKALTVVIPEAAG